MATPIGQYSFATGEISPSLFGHVDLARVRVAAATARNVFVSFRGGLNSRAGTAFVGYSKQTGRSYPPRMIPFQFSINQGLALEFGNFYMRVISDGAYVTNNGVAITGVTQASPAVLTAPTTGGETATPNNGAVTASYAPNDTVTLAGGVYTTPATLSITNTTLLSVQAGVSTGNGYVPADTIDLAGGTQSSTPIVTVASTQVTSATIAAGGTGGTNGTQTVTGTTGTGTKFQASVNIVGGIIIAVNSITVSGNYTANPSNLAAEPVTGAGLSGATLTITMGVLNLTISNGGVFTVNSPLGQFTQASTSGSGTGATFALGIFGPNNIAVSNAGSYSVLPSNPVSQASTSGVGRGATFNLTSGSVAAFNSGDWIFLDDIVGMVQMNNRTVVVQQLSISTFALYDVFGNPIDSTAYSPYASGGVAASIFTLATPYSEQDLPYLKFTQSADVMSICCVNQQTLVEYPPYDLSRTSDTQWAFTQIAPQPTIAPPPGTPSVSVTPPPSGSDSYQSKAFYEYEITAVNPNDGSESIASSIGEAGNVTDISQVLGKVTVNWNAVPGANEYNVYRTAIGYLSYAPVGSLFGYVGTAYGNQFLDDNIVPDFTQVPPTHQNPFARSPILSVVTNTGGNGYTEATGQVNTLTGTGAVLVGVVTNGSVNAWIIEDSGENYDPSTDTVTVVGDGTGATATLNIGPLSGTYPATVNYFQERRAYAYSLNNPDTYWLSQPGSYTNFDSRLPTIASDSVTGSPWAVEVNGIQWMVQTSGGLLVLTGLSAWLLAGVGSFATNVQPITPSQQDAVPQAFTGCSAILPPIRINYDVIYVESKGSFYYDLPYQLYTLSEPIDLTEVSSHLFIGHTMREHAWCEQPYKLLWAVRDDGILLSLTFYKTQQVAGWARHDTEGLYQSVCSIVELPIDALYLASERTINSQTSYMVERMDNRIWSDVEQCWCVDAGLSLAQPEPQAMLSVNSATGLGSITGVTGLIGGEGYSSATIATVVDDDGEGPGTGAVPTLTILGGVITAVTFAGGSQGSGYTFPRLDIFDPANTGSGASATLILNNSATFTASAAVFSSGNIGSFIRVGGGIAEITAFTDSEHVVGNILSPIVSVVTDDSNAVVPQPAGSWTLSPPVNTINGLYHLIGTTVTGLADGNVITPRVVNAQGQITLDRPASAVTIGLGFTAQIQSTYADAGEPTVQGQRKKIAALTARLEASRDLMAGANQPDGSTLSPPQIAPNWEDLQALENSSPYDEAAKRKPYNALCAPLYTADRRVPLPGGFQKQGQVAIQQSSPLPLNLLAFVPELLSADKPEQEAAPKQRGRGR